MSNLEWNHDLQIFEYLSVANPKMPPILLNSLEELHAEEVSKTEIITLDLSKQLQTSYPATTPNCLASFVYIQSDSSIEIKANATSHLFMVIKGSGLTKTPFGEVKWAKGDVIVIPACDKIIHNAAERAVLYWVNDEPLLNYLGVKPAKPSFPPTHYPYKTLMEKAAEIDKDPQARMRNRNGILLGSPACPLTHTITPVLWSLYNTIHPGQVQAAHRHNSVALDLCLKGSPDVFTLMGKELDEQGNIKNPQRADWISGGMFVTPPGWWHSHHNESNQDALVFPVQDAGLQTYMRTLDIQFTGGV